MAKKKMFDNKVMRIPLYSPESESPQMIMEVYLDLEMKRRGEKKFKSQQSSKNTRK